MTTPGYPLELFRDDFTASLDTHKWTVSGSGSASASSGQLTLDSTNGAVSVSSALSYDMVASAAYVELVSVSSTDNVAAALSISSTAGDFSWNYNLNSLRAQYSTGSYSSSIPSMSLPIYLRIRQQSGVIYWDYSYDASSWTNLTTETLAAPTQATSVTMEVGTYPSSSVFTFSNFNTLD